MEYFRGVTNAVTGEYTVEPFTPEEIAEIEAQRAAAVVEARGSMRLSFAQLLIGLVTEGWITEAEGDAWADGTLPFNVQLLIDGLPQDQRFAARIRAKRPSEVLRLDPLVVQMATAMGKTDATLDAFFLKYAQV